MKSFFFYDFETTGIDTKKDRPIQFAGIRTDQYFNVISKPLNMYCQLDPDILPNPLALLTTGITLENILSGLKEYEFTDIIRAEFMKPNTCIAGFNNIRFDDEFLRFLFYRNLYDPYEHEYKNNNSRIDILDMVRALYALKPQAINFPVIDDNVSLKLENLTRANNIEHTNAHDALSDVYATINLAALISKKEAKFFNYYCSLSSKDNLRKIIQQNTPIVHVSDKFARENSYTGIVIPIMPHPINSNSWIVWDLRQNPAELLSLSTTQIYEWLYMSCDELNIQQKMRIGLKEIRLNRTAFVVTTKVLKKSDYVRLNIDTHAIETNINTIVKTRESIIAKLKQVYSRDYEAQAELDADTALYAGFFHKKDKSALAAIHSLMHSPDEAYELNIELLDARLNKLRYRYFARNFPELLTPKLQSAWKAFINARLNGDRTGAPTTIHQFKQFFDDIQKQSSDIVTINNKQYAKAELLNIRKQWLGRVAKYFVPDGR